MHTLINEITCTHIAAIKACVAIANLGPCTDELLIEEMNEQPKNFAFESDCCIYKDTVISFNNNDTVMLIGQYFLRLTKNKNYWTCSHKDYFGSLVGDTAIEAVCNCIANLNNMELDI